MTSQEICAAIETPIIAAFSRGNLPPLVKISFDNTISFPPDKGDHIIVNITFASGTVETLTGILRRPRGAVIARILTDKGKGAGRARELADTVLDVFHDLACAQKTSDSIHVKTKNISGPELVSSDDLPFFVVRVSAGWEASSPG